jgi:hypothetical protein
MLYKKLEEPTLFFNQRNAGDITYNVFKEVELETQQTGGFLYSNGEKKKKKQDGTTTRLKKLVLKTKKNYTTLLLKKIII